MQQLAYFPFSWDVTSFRGNPTVNFSSSRLNKHGDVSSLNTKYHV